MKYRTIVADPPWDYDRMTTPWRSTSARSYDLMSVPDIAAIPVADLADEAAHLYLWAVLPLMAEAFDVVRDWGFRPCTVLTWCKPGVGLGSGYRGNTEHLIVGRRGTHPNINPSCAVCGGAARGASKCECASPEWRYRGRRVPPVEAPFRDKADGTWYVASRGEHSEKPELFLDLVERMSPGPYLELFARRARFGWAYWGDESLGTAEMPAA